MQVRKNVLTLSIVAALGMSGVAVAQDAGQQAKDLDKVVVTGIRGSMEKSLDVKREAKAHVEVVSAEDIGKMPDKNVADSLQRLPGVTISSAGASEGGFDENDRVSMRGTNPSLTLTQINGHPVSSGDWFVLNQSDNAGRSVSYTLLPSTLVSQVVVHKTSQAKLAEGGVTGAVDIITRKPLDFAKTFTGNVSIGGVYSDLPGKTDSQFSALLNFRNEASTAGVLLQVFDENRSLRRDGVEVLGYDQISNEAGSPTKPVADAHPDLNGVWYPRMLGSALFEQKRERRGGLLEVQFRPSDSFSFDLSGFVSNLDASNYNRNYLLYNPRTIGAGISPAAGYVVKNNTLVSAVIPDTGAQYGLYDMIARPDEKARTTFLSASAEWRASDRLSFDFKVGTSTGHGETPTQDVAEWRVGGAGASWSLNGIDNAPSFSLNEGTSAPQSNLALDWIFGLQNLDIEDKDKWGQIDGELIVDNGAFSSLEFGVRVANHDRSSANVIAQGPACINSSGAVVGFDWSQADWCPVGTKSPANPANFPGSYGNYPGDFGSGFGGNFPRDVWYYSAGDMGTYNVLTTRDPVDRRYPVYEFGLKEKTSAAYVQFNLEGDRWNGNLGLRVVKTSQDVLQYLAGGTASTPGAIQGSAFGIYTPQVVSNDYTDVLPSANFKFDLSDDLVARLAVTKTLARPDYSALAGGLSLSPPNGVNDIGGGSSSNPNLKPIRSTNFDASLEWYYAPRSMLSASAYYMDLSSYIGQGQSEQEFLTFDQAHPDGYMGKYLVNSPINTKGSVKGLEFAVEQPIGENFGISANYSYTDAKESNGKPLMGASRNVFNLVGYFENNHLNARIAYNYRSHFYNGLDRRSAFNQDDTQSVSASLGWKFNDTFSVTLDGMNLTNEKLKYYAENRDQPRGIYNNGRQYYLNLRINF